MAHSPWSAPDHLTGTFRGLGLAICLLLATVAAPLPTAPAAAQVDFAQSDPIALATRGFEDTVARGDALAAAGNYCEAVVVNWRRDAGPSPAC